MIPQRSFALPILLAFLLLLLPAAYVGSYVALVDRSGRLVMGNDAICRVQEYRYGGQIAVWFFLPARLIDERLRPDQ